MSFTQPPLESLQSKESSLQLKILDMKTNLISHQDAPRRQGITQRPPSIIGRIHREDVGMGQVAGKGLPVRLVIAETKKKTPKNRGE